MVTKEKAIVSKDIQKVILKTMCESPALGLEDLTISSKGKNNEITQEQVIQVLQIISAETNWQNASEEKQKEIIIDYVFNLEAQVLYLYPTKQKENAIADFNQMRLKNSQNKVSKDLIRHLQSVLMVEGKTLGKFRKFDNDLTVLEDVDANYQTMWALRELLMTMSGNEVSSVKDMPSILEEKLKEKFPELAENVGKTLQRISERFVDRYFPKSLSLEMTRDRILQFQEINKKYKNYNVEMISSSASTGSQGKLIKEAVLELQEVKKMIEKSHEGGIIGKLFSGTVKNKDGITKQVDLAINKLNDATEASSSVSSATNEKTLLVQKLQGDYENLLLVKNQVESELASLSQDLASLKERNEELEKELEDVTSSLEKSHEKIAEMQQSMDKALEAESNSTNMKEDLDAAKEISLRLYRRVQKLKADMTNIAPQG